VYVCRIDLSVYSRHGRSARCDSPTVLRQTDWLLIGLVLKLLSTLGLHHMCIVCVTKIIVLWFFQSKKVLLANQSHD
jgi:hypothetical protein